MQKKLCSLKQFLNSKAVKIGLVVLVLCLVGGVVLIGEAIGADSALKILITGNLGEARGELPRYEDPVPIVKLVIQGLLSIIAIIFFILIIIAGFRWMTAGGNEETVTNAKKNISNAVIGLLIVMFSYGVTRLVFDVILGK